MMKQIMEFEGDVHIDGDVYNFTFIARSLDTTILDLPEFEGQVVSSNDSRFVNYTMIVDKDAVDNLLVVEIIGLGIKLFFRPPCTDGLLNNMELPMVPGAVFNIKKENWKMVDLERSNFGIASFPLGPSLKDKATELNVSKPVYVQYLMLDNSTTEIGYNDSLCSETYRIFTQECRMEHDKLEMLQTCSSIYAEKKFLECLTEKHSMEEYSSIQKKFFQRCEMVLCKKDAVGCKNMLMEMPFLTKCPLPEKIKTIDCSTILLDLDLVESDLTGFY